MKIEVKNWGNETVREIDLPEAVFGYPYKEHLIHEAVQAYLAAQRRGANRARVLRVSEERDPEFKRRLWRMSEEASQDTPRSVPWTPTPWTCLMDASN